MASDDDFPLIDSSCSSPQPHAHTRHPPLDQTSINYYSHQAPTFDDSVPDPNKSGPGAPTPPKRTSAAHSYKRHKCNSGESESGNESYRGDNRKDREEWSDTAIACLLEAYTEKYNQLNRGNLRGRDWEEVAEAVADRCVGGDKTKTNKSVEQCKNKIDNLKKRYKVEMQRMSATGTTTHWHWFKKMEVIAANSSSKAGSDEDRSNSHVRLTRQSKRFLFLLLVHYTCNQ